MNNKKTKFNLVFFDNNYSLLENQINSLYITKVRQAKVRDFESIFTLIQELWGQHEFNKQKIKSLFLQQIKIKGAIQLIIEEEDKIIGYGSAYPRLDIEAGGEVINISELVIRKGYRRKGYSKKIFTDIVARAKQKGYKEIYLISSFKRLDAHKFYKDLECQKIGYFFGEK